MPEIVGTSVGTRSITLPADILEGDLILVHWHAAGSFPVEVTGGPAGYQIETYHLAGLGNFNHEVAPSFPTDYVSHAYVYSRVADGTEGGSSVSLSGTTSVRSLSSVVRGVDHGARARPVFSSTGDGRPEGEPLVIPISLSAARPFVGFMGSYFDFMTLVASAGFSVVDQVAFGTDRVGRIASDGSARSSVTVQLAATFTAPVMLFAVAYDDDALPAFVEPPPPRVATDRYRLQVSADSRSLLASSSAVPFDTSVTLSLPPAVGRLPQQTLYQIREVTRAASDPTFDAAFYPRATQNTLQERTYDGITLLSLMRTAFPAPLNATTNSLAIPDPNATALITYVLTSWATQFPWFSFVTVPDLRTPIPGSSGVALPSEYDTGFDVPRFGAVRSSVLAFPQTRDNRLSMYDILEQLLSPFPGTVFFGNAAGALQIVPVYGPDADEIPYKTLTTSDVVSSSLGEPSVSTIINRATVSSRGNTVGTDVQLMQPSWFQIGPPSLLGTEEEGLWFTPPNDRNNLQATEDGGILQESLTPARWVDQANLVWPMSTNVIPAGSGISFYDTAGVPQVTVAYKVIENGSSVVASGTTGLDTDILDTVPFDGSQDLAIRWAATVEGQPMVVNVLARWDAAANAVALIVKSALLEVVTGGLFPKRYSVIVEFTLDDASQGATETTGVTATFGVTADGDSIPGEGGVNAIAESQTAFGVLETRVDVRGYVLTATQALGIARGLVLANLSPRAIRDYELGWKGSTVALLDDRGRLFGTPGGGQGLLVGNSYQDDFIAVTGGKSIRVEETIEGADGFIPADASWLLVDSGDFWVNDDSTFSGPA